MGKVSKAARQRQDYLRRKALKVGKGYETSLIRARRKEVARVLRLCRDNYADPAVWADAINLHLDESAYLGRWYRNLYHDVGMPMAQSVANGLLREKAMLPKGVWEESILDYATERAGENIVMVEGTLKRWLVDTLGAMMEESVSTGVEALASGLFDAYKGDIELWMARRIAQTETMIALGNSADIAAHSLDIPMLKQWSCSGLASTRDTHRVMDGVIVKGNEYFQLEDCRMQFPCDTSTNPPASEIINCACTCIYLPDR